MLTNQYITQPYIFDTIAFLCCCFFFYSALWSRI